PIPEPTPGSARPRIMAILAVSARRRASVLGGALVAGLGIFGAIGVSARKPAIKLFWAPLLRGPDPVLVVTDTLVGLREQTPPGPEDSSRPVRDIIDPKAFLRVSQESAKLASFLLANDK